MEHGRKLYAIQLCEDLTSIQKSWVFCSLYLPQTDLHMCRIYFIVNLWTHGFLFFSDNVSPFYSRHSLFMLVLKEVKGGKIPMFCDTASSWMSEKFKQSQAFWIKVWCDPLPRLIASLTKGCCFSHPGLEAHAHDCGSFRFADYAHAEASLKTVWAKDSLLCKGCVIREIGTALQWRTLMRSSSDSAFQTHLSSKI